MSPIRQQLLDEIAQTPDIDLEAIVQFLQSRRRLTRTKPMSAAQQAWNQVVHQFNESSPEQRQHQKVLFFWILVRWG